MGRGDLDQSPTELGKARKQIEIEGIGWIAGIPYQGETGSEHVIQRHNASIGQRHRRCGNG